LPGSVSPRPRQVSVDTGARRDDTRRQRHAAIVEARKERTVTRTTEAHSDPAIEAPSTCAVAMKLEVVVIPVSDVERAKRFYARLGWRLDADFDGGEDFHIVQFTPPGSTASIHVGQGLTAAAPGSAQGLFLIVSDIHEARGELIDRGARVSEVFHRRGYASFASFSDPDGNQWLLQEITARLPGRADPGLK
jgi:catechol 2,3-dioxygenase-like lactoylglutathione lyase family enzyme